MDNQKKPRVFIGSSAESLKIAKAIQRHLQYQVEPTVWSQGVFIPAQTTLESLDERLDKTDFGIFVFGLDDVIRLRNKEFLATRDNVVFELGLFIGKLGRRRNFIVKPRDIENFHLPTDLLGITPATYDPKRQDGDLFAALGPACDEILEAIQRQLIPEQLLIRPSPKIAISLDKAHRVNSHEKKLRLSAAVLDWQEATFLFWTNLDDELAHSDHNRYLFSHTTDIRDESNHPDGFFLYHKGRTTQWKFRFHRAKADLEHNVIVFDNAPNTLGIHLITVRWSQHERFCELLFDAGTSWRRRVNLSDWQSWPRSSQEPFNIGGWYDNYDGGLSNTCFIGIRCYDTILSDAELRNLYESEKTSVERLLSSEC